MVKLTVMCGLQGSGKSTKASEFGEVFSSDEIRKDGGDNETVFKELYRRVNECLRAGKDAVIDATNITNKARRQVFANIKVDCIKTCYIMNTPFDICLERVNERNKDLNEHFVPLDVLKRYYESFEIPFYEEGWDNIILDRKVGREESEKRLAGYVKAAEGFNQRNKHHTQDLGAHMKRVGDILANGILSKAGYYHDVGKLFTQTMSEDGECHYYNHDSVGAYRLMCESALWGEEYDLAGTLRWLFYVNYHMKLHQVVTEKSVNKWKRILGEDLYNDLRIFEQADKAR